MIIDGKTNDGGPASPHDMSEMSEMSLRDYAAIHADIGDLELGSLTVACEFLGINEPDNPTLHDLMTISAKVVARVRYIFADELIRERGEQK